METSLRNKISEIVKYSSLYVGNSSAIEERSDMNFNIELPEETNILEKMKNKKIIILTGEAGDGKSRMIKNLKKHEISSDFECIDDFSALNNLDKENILNRIFDVLNGSLNKKLLIAANIGILVRYILKGKSKLTLELLREHSDCFIVNFENRNLANDPATFNKIVKVFFNINDFNCFDSDCVHQLDCPFIKNFIDLNNDIIIENLRFICNAIFLMGGHITFRELLALLASLATSGYDCESIGNLKLNISYYNIFDRSDGAVLSKISVLDPSKQSDKPDEDLKLFEKCNTDLSQYRSEKRHRFFISTDKNAYQKLSVKYLNEFNNTLDLMNRYPYYYDVTENNEVLLNIKEGLVRLLSPGRTDLEIGFFDMPAPFQERIKTKFSIDFDQLTLVWNHPDWNVNKQNREINNFRNYFFLSAIYLNGDTPQCKSLKIDFMLFQYICKAKENYYFSSVSNVFHEHGLSDFFKNVLSINPKFSEKIEILFEHGKNDQPFEMSFYSPNHILKGVKKKIKIKTISGGY